MWFFTPFAGSLLRTISTSVLRSSTGRLFSSFESGLSGFARGFARGFVRMDAPSALIGGQPRTIVIKVTSNMGDAGRWFGDVGKQVRWATVEALTKTTKRLVPVMERSVVETFDRPVPFTVRAFGTSPATLAMPSSTIFIKDRQARYLLPNIRGGMRGQKTFEKRLGVDTGVRGFWAPGEGVSLTAAGNLTRDQIKEIASRISKSGLFSDVFVGVPTGHPHAPFGIWARESHGKDRGIRPLLVKIPQPRYQPRFRFYDVAKRNAPRIFSEEFKRSFDKAMKTVKPISQIEDRVLMQKVIKIG